MTDSPAEAVGVRRYAVAKKNLWEWHGAPPVVLAGDLVEVLDDYDGQHERMLKVRTPNGMAGDWAAACFRTVRPTSVQEARATSAPRP